MKPTHTPGPWVIKDGDIRDGRPRGRTIAKIRTYDYGWILPQHMEEQDANTKLIASAPCLLRERDELLAALERALNERIGQFVDPADDPLCVDLSYVIAKAKGGAE